MTETLADSVSPDLNEEQKMILNFFDEEKDVEEISKELESNKIVAFNVPGYED